MGYSPAFPDDVNHNLPSDKGTRALGSAKGHKRKKRKSRKSRKRGR